MPKKVYDKCKATMFKPGSIPVNHKPVGCERLDRRDGYIMIKVSEPNKWRLKHRVIWEKKRGRIPAGYNVSFKDGDKTNIKISNLVLRSKKQNMLRNSIHSKGPEIARACQLLGALNRQINKHAKHK